MHQEKYIEKTTDSYLRADVVIPYWEKDRHLAVEAYDSILAQIDCCLVIHLVADGCEPVPTKTHASHMTLSYSTPGGWGPFRITNELIDHYRTPYLALLDADDLAMFNRMAKQLEMMERGYDMTTAAMAQVPIEGYEGNRIIQNPIIIPGIEYSTTPKGRVINSTRMIRVDVFKELNGFHWCLRSGDFQFDNRILHVLPEYNTHFSCEMVGVRRMRPTSLSNMPGESVSWTLFNTIQLMKENPTKRMAWSLGMLDKNSGELATHTSAPTETCLTTHVN